MVNQVRTYACLPNQDWTPDKVSRLPDTKVLYNLKLFHIYYIKTEQILEMRKIYKEQQKYIAIIGSVFIGNPRKSHSGLKIRDSRHSKFFILFVEAFPGQLMFIIDR